MPVAYIATNKACPVGSWYADELARCEVCPRGYFTSQIGSKTCISCNDMEDRFQDDANQTGCKKCPPNTHRRFATDAFKSKFGCTCRENFWAPDLAEPYTCEECPQNGVCLGGTNMPYALGGFWTVIVNTSRPVPSLNFSAVEQANTADGLFQAKHSGSFVRCGIFGKTGCLQSDGDKTAQCARGYDGVACSRCAPNHYVFFGKCYECGKARNVLLVVGLYFGWFLLNKYLCERLNSIDTYLAFAQMANVV